MYSLGLHMYLCKGTANSLENIHQTEVISSENQGEVD